MKPTDLNLEGTYVELKSNRYSTENDSRDLGHEIGNEIWY